MQLSDKNVTLYFHIIFISLLIINVLIILLRWNNPDTKHVFWYFKNKFSDKIFWTYLIIFSVISFLLHDDFIMKNVHEDKKRSFRYAIKLGWLVAIASFFGDAGFTITLGMLAAFLYVFFKVDL